LRILAVKKMVEQLHAAPADARAWPRALVLGAATIHYLNSTFAAEPVGGRWRWLNECVGRFINDEETETLVAVGKDHGMWFFADIFTNDRSPRIPRAARLDLDQLCLVFSVGRLADLEQLLGAYNNLPLRGPEKANPLRTQNRRAVTYRVADVRRGPPLPKEDVRLTERGIVERAPVRMAPEPWGGNLAPEDSDEEEADNRDVNTKVSDIWQNFPHSVINGTINWRSRSGPSHLTMPLEMRSEVTAEIFMSLDLSSVFRAVYVRAPNQKAWDAIFDRFFPVKTFVPTAAHFQHYPKAGYYLDWKSLRERLNEQGVEVARHAFRKRFNKLLWVPYAEGDRIWRTSHAHTHGDMYRVPAQPPKAPAPTIALNPRVYRPRLHQVVVGDPEIIDISSEEDQEA
jgi:hypothetical protein